MILRRSHYHPVDTESCVELRDPVKFAPLVFGIPSKSNPVMVDIRVHWSMTGPVMLTRRKNLAVRDAIQVGHGRPGACWVAARCCIIAHGTTVIIGAIAADKKRSPWTSARHLLKLSHVRCICVLDNAAALDVINQDHGEAPCRERPRRCRGVKDGVVGVKEDV